ncbi:MFS general substrate transporter [Meredithblackwellia eburnea MCA 4105]
MPANEPRTTTDVEKGAQPVDATNKTSDELEAVTNVGGGKEGRAAGEKPRKEVETQHIPNNNLWLVFPALMLATFLAALDQTIVSTTLPKTIKALHGSESTYSWVGVAYTLMAACCAPLYGKLSQIWGPKVLIYFAIVMFVLGSALCGAAKNMIWLCVCRGVQGIGGGGILQLTQIIISYIVPLQDRGKWSGGIGATWGIASALGPLVGGLLTDRVSWRWIYWINLPTGGLALVMLVFTLKLNPNTPMTLAQFRRTFDFFGLFLIMGGTALLLVGFNFGESDWKASETIALLTVGGVTLVAAGVWETKTTRSPIIPPRLFKTRTTVCILLCVWIHSFAFISSSYYLPLYLQIRGASATMAGVGLIPLSLGSSIVSIVSGFILSKTLRYRGIIIVSFLFCILGFALIATLDEKSSRVQEEMYFLICALGVGSLFQVPLVGLQCSVPVADMATATASLGLLRQLGGTISISVSGAIYSSELTKRLSGIAGYTAPTSSALSGNVGGLTKIEPISLRNEVLHAYTRSISVIWEVTAPILFVGFVLSCCLKHYSMERNVNRTGGESTDEKTVVEGGGEPLPEVVSEGAASKA